MRKILMIVLILTCMVLTSCDSSAKSVSEANIIPNVSEELVEKKIQLEAHKAEAQEETQKDDLEVIKAFKISSRGQMSRQMAMEFPRRLVAIASTFEYKDTDFLRYVVSVEKELDLEPCELIALGAKENEFKNKTIVEHDGITSYGVYQMRMFIAKPAYKYLVKHYPKYEYLPAPTDEKLRNDRLYQTLLAGAYLKYLHSETNNGNEVFAWYNAGIGGKERYKDNNYSYKYTKEYFSYLSKFQKIMGEYY